MSANTLLSLVTQGLFVLIFFFTLVQAIRRPLRTNVEVAILFGVLAVIVAESWLYRALATTPPPLVNMLISSLLMALPYLQLRLVDAFAGVPAWLMRAAEAGLALSVVALFTLGTPLPGAVTALLVLYFFALQLYSAIVFVRESTRTSGLTRRRMQSVAAGSVCLGLVILAAGFGAVEPRLQGVVTGVSSLLALASGIAYYIGFTPPGLLRRAWQEPELRAFLGRVASLPRLPDSDAVVRELERGVASVVGAPRALVVRWDPERDVLVSRADDTAFEFATGEMFGGRAFTTQQPVLSVNAPREDPAHADLYRRFNARAVLAAPVTAGDHRLGALVIYAPRAPIFAEDDLVLLRLLAAQAAVVLEARALIEDAARVQAREEATRLKDDFLSAAAHDLKTPLTTISAQAQLIERRAARDPGAPADIEGVQRIVRESRRLNRLVMDLLESSRVEHGQLVGRREPVDLVQLAQESCASHTSDRHPCIVMAEKAVIGMYDRVRISQLIENLLENAIKFSPDGGEVTVRIAQDADRALITVTDHGIGIKAEDLPHIFERFQRGANVDDRRFAGMGLGLFLCRGIVEQHGGRIDVSSRPGRGSAFSITLPLGDEGGGHE